MDTQRPTPEGEDADQTQVRPDPRFDEQTRRDARSVVPLGHNVREQPSPSARQIARQRAIIFILFIAVLILVGAVIYLLQTRYGTTPVTPITQPPPTIEQPPPSSTPTALPSPSASATPSVSPSLSPTPSAAVTLPPTPSPAPNANSNVSPNSNTNSNTQLLIPVQGVRADQLQDTYTQSRSEGRVHNAIDIMAAKGTPVIAATDGTVVKLFRSERGGTTLYVRGTDGRTIYYYAHLAAYAEGLSENKFVHRGETVGYVGDTGNAGPGNYHLHFEISITDDPQRWYGGRSVNPYPLLTGKY